jgi:hypothetical protein
MGGFCQDKETTLKKFAIVLGLPKSVWPFLKCYMPRVSGSGRSADYTRHSILGAVTAPLSSALGSDLFRDGKNPCRPVASVAIDIFNFSDPNCLFHTHFGIPVICVGSRVFTNARDGILNHSCGLVDNGLAHYELVSNESDR